MTATGLRTFDSTVQTTNSWLNELQEELHWDDRQRAYHAMRAVFAVIAGHVTEGEIEHVRSCCPKPIRELWPAA